jgi:ketosteroid isomerase-like protein
MAEHPNAARAREGYEAFSKGDLAALSNYIAEDVVWNILGAGPLSGSYKGRDEVFTMFGRLAQETGGTFHLDVHDILANDEHIVALCTLSAQRAGKSLSVPVANVEHVNKDGQITEFWGATTDPQATIDFWS